MDARLNRRLRYKGTRQHTDLHHKYMPKGTKVHKVYDALTSKGMSKGKAARIAQSKTGKSLATGKKPKSKKGYGGY